MNKGEHIEYISSTLKLIVSQDHTFGTDALLLASFSCPKKNDKAVDLGAGCGIIPFYWLRSGCKGSLYGVDIQPAAVNQMTRSIEINDGADNFTPVLSDLRELKGVLPFGAFDTVVMNPPYKQVGAGILSSGESDVIARHETMCSLDDLCRSASKLLRFGGSFSICHRPERICDIFEAMRKNKIEPKKMRLVCQRDGLAPWLVLVQGRRGGKPGMTVMPNLYVESDETERIIGEYRKG